MRFLSVKNVVVSAIVVNFLDALTTYYILVTHVGDEANPLLVAMYHENPLSTFIVFVITSVMFVRVVSTYDVLIRMVPRAAVAQRVFLVASTCAIALKAAVVVNNLYVIFAGYAPLVETLSRIYSSPHITI